MGSQEKSNGRIYPSNTLQGTAIQESTVGNIQNGCLISVADLIVKVKQYKLYLIKARTSGGKVSNGRIFLK